MIDNYNLFNMKSFIYKLLAVVILTIASSFCLFSQTRVISHKLSPFTGIEASDDFKVSITISDSYNAKLTVDDALESYVQCYVKGGTLYIGLDKKAVPKDLKKQYKGRNAAGPTLVANVQLPLLKSITLQDEAEFSCPSVIAAQDLTMNLGGSSSAGRLRITGKSFKLTVDKNAKFTEGRVSVEEDMVISCDSKGKADLEYQSENLLVTNGGSGEITLKGSADDKVSVTTSGSAKTTLSGSSKELELTGKGTSGVVDASDHEADSASLAVTGVNASVKAMKNLELDLGRGAEVYFFGNPEINIVRIQNASVIRK